MKNGEDQEREKATYKIHSPSQQDLLETKNGGEENMRQIGAYSFRAYRVRVQIGSFINCLGAEAVLLLTPSHPFFVWFVRRESFLYFGVWVRRVLRNRRFSVGLRFPRTQKLT